jgi:steroid 5-alpha reductase family enzyme
MGGEWLADLQLARFRANPENCGKVCQRGLWNYSRHPNYFFEWLHWFAYVALSIGAPAGVISLVGPVAMLLFLLFLTGIPHVEREAAAKRGEAYRQYQQTTSMLIPLPKRRNRK